MGPYVGKMFFLQSRQINFSGYTGVWHKNVETNILLFNFTRIDYLLNYLINLLDTWTETLPRMHLPIRQS